MRRNNIRQRLSAGETALGVFVTFPSPALVEICGLLGFDWVFIDAEHGPMGLETVEHMVRAAETVGITPIVRMPYPEPTLINRILDTGAMGVLVPHLDSVALARAVVDAAKYHPLGRRGAGSRTRAADFGFGRSASDYASWANSETLILGILEDVQVIERLPEMLQVEGLDGFVIGPSDLSQSMQLAWQSSHPEVVEAVDHITNAVLASDKMLCRVLIKAETAVQEARQFIDRGVPLIATSATGLLALGARDLLQLKKP